ncbi:MAG: hypothetical protein M1831_003732 [Alyxoria varia]|nr:MAG: hypothetical protein M1831_003732 [Alyxoria varia]
MLVSGLTHWGVVILSLASRIMPFMFAEKYQDSLSPVAMFDPAPFWTGDVRTSESVHEGVLMFLQWDELVCCLSILVWAVAINRDSLYAHDKGSTFKSMVWRLVFGTIVAGPAAAAISLVLERDEALLESSEQTLEKRED